MGNSGRHQVRSKRRCVLCNTTQTWFLKFLGVFFYFKLWPPVPSIEVSCYLSLTLPHLPSSAPFYVTISCPGERRNLDHAFSHLAYLKSIVYKMQLKYVTNLRWSCRKLIRTRISKYLSVSLHCLCYPSSLSFTPSLTKKSQKDDNTYVHSRTHSSHPHIPYPPATLPSIPPPS